MSTRRDAYEARQGGSEGEKLKVETIDQSPSVNLPARTTPTIAQGPSTSMVPCYSSEEPLDEHATAVLWSSQASFVSSLPPGNTGYSQPQTKFPHIEEAQEWIKLCKSTFGTVTLPPRTWMGCVAGEDMYQVNGPSFEDGTTVPSTFLSDDPDHANSYIACTVSPGGHQINGPDVPFDNGHESSMNPRPSDNYLACGPKKETANKEVEKEVRPSVQVNGPNYRRGASARNTVGYNGVPKQDD